MRFRYSRWAFLLTFLLIACLCASCASSPPSSTETSSKRTGAYSAWESDEETSDAFGFSFIEPSFRPGDETNDERSEPVTSSDPSENSSSEETSDTSSSSEASVPPPPQVEDTVVSFLACGDNLIHPSVYFYAMECAANALGESCTYVATNDANYDFLPIYENVASRMRGADLCYVNQETLSGGDGTKIDGYPKFNSPEAVGRTLKELGVDVVNLAHNHMLDSRDDSFLIHTDGFIRSLGMTPIGYYANEAATNTITVVESKGVRFAFLPYTESTNGITCKTQTKIPYFEEALIRKQVALAKSVADVVIVSAHWGNEYAFQANSNQKNYAKLFCDLGVDVVLGMHSHCLEPMQWMEGADGHRMLLTYSLGNFVSGMQEGQTTLEGMLSFNVRKDGKTGKITVEEPMLTPIVLHYTYVRSVDSSLDTGYRNFKIYDLCDYTEELASQHGVTKRWEGTRGKPGTLYENGKTNGKYSLKNLYETLYTLIPEEFLPEVYKRS